MKTGWSERIRNIADRDYVRPARARQQTIKIVVGDIHDKLRAEGFPTGHTNQICSSLESGKFWRARGLRLRSPLNQPRLHSTVFEYTFDEIPKAKSVSKAPEKDHLLALRGILKGAIREGAKAFIKELRKDKE